MWSIISSLDIISEDPDMHNYDEKKDVLKRIFSKQREEDPSPSKPLKDLIKEEKFDSDSSMPESPMKSPGEARLDPHAALLDRFDTKNEPILDFGDKAVKECPDNRFEQEFFEEDEQLPDVSPVSKKKKAGKAFNQSVEQLVLQFISDFIEAHGSPASRS